VVNGSATGFAVDEPVGQSLCCYQSDGSTHNPCTVGGTTDFGATSSRPDVYFERMFGNEGSMLDELRTDPMMARLLDDLAAGKDVGHYGRLVVAMVGQHFATEDELVALLSHDPDFPEDKARVMVRTVIDTGYSPPSREKILEFQSRQEYPIIENPEDPDAGNVYKHLQFPNDVYDHIEHYHEQKLHTQ
jgi:hypothetical protein